MSRRAAILGCAGPVLGAEERAFFREVRPAGFILFQRNCVDPDQLARLIADLREAVDDAETPVLVDQEGGRVQRLKPPHWRAAPSAGRLGALPIEAAERAVFLNARLIAEELRPLGFTATCAPVLDVPQPGSHGVIGDRAFGTDSGLVARLGRACRAGLMEGGILPVVKHMPGHGRAQVDSHEACPVVEAAEAELATDLAPFLAHRDAPLAMTAHVVFTAWDRDRPATLSPTVIGEVIRGRIGFAGALMSDDLSMKALGGSLEERARGAIAAGCDLALHCNGVPQEMAAVAGAVPDLIGAAEARWRAALATRRRAAELDAAAALAELEGLLQ